MAGTIPTLAAVVLTPAEVAAGYTAYPHGTGFDCGFCLAGAVLDLKSAAQKLATVIGSLPAGANSAIVAAQLVILLSTNVTPSAVDGGSASSTYGAPGIDGGTATSTYTFAPLDGGSA